MDRPAGSSKLLRGLNTSAVLSHLLTRGPLTRGDVRELTGLSKPTTSDVLRTLVNADLAVVVGHTSGKPGPSAEIYAANPDGAYAAALSVRETDAQPEVSMAIVDLDGAIRARSMVSLDLSVDDPAATLANAIKTLCKETDIPAERVRHTHIGVPGSYDHTNDTIHHVDVPGLDRPGLVTTLRRILGGPVVVDNDVNLAAIAERHRGVAAHAETFALLWLDHGLGLAIDLGGTLMRGAHGGAGEIGYMPLGLPARRDMRYETNDLDGVLAGPAVMALAASHGVLGSTPRSVVESGGAAFIAALAQRVAIAAAAVVAVLDPDLIVLAGAVGQAGGPRLRDAVAIALRSASPLEAPIATTALADDAVLLGALDAGLAAVRDDLIRATQDATTAT
jgi:predicted NBD/HSP70 family sugar kinase